MEGRACNFEKLLADFEARLKGAEFVSIDTELTGVDIEGEPEGFLDSAAQRLDKFCRVAERFSIIQLGLTVVGKIEDGRYPCASYNIFAFPYVGPELLSIGRDPGFHCSAAALKFNSQHDVNFNTWIAEGVPYVCREDEEQYLSSCQATPSTSSATAGDETQAADWPQKSGLLRLWKSLCAAQLPLIVHTPVDLFFLLAAFECRNLPRDDPRELARLVRVCSPEVYDTAHLHSALGQFRRLGLTKFHEDAQVRHEQLMRKSAPGVTPVAFELEPETAARYGNGNEMAHEAGFDALITAQLFLYLRAISPTRVKDAADRLYLHKSFNAIDLRRAERSLAGGKEEAEIGRSLYDLSRITLLVAELPPRGAGECDAPRRISNAGSEYKWIDATHILVLLKAVGPEAVRKVQELAAKAPGVLRWVAFDEWREEQKALQPAAGVRARDRIAKGENPYGGVVASNSSSTMGWCRGFGTGAAVASFSFFLLSVVASQLRKSRRRR